MVRKIIDTTPVKSTIAKLMECSGLTERAAWNFRIMAHGVLSRKGDLSVGASNFGEGVTDIDQEIIDAGLVTLGKWSATNHPMAMSHHGDFAAEFTAKGLAMAEGTVKYEAAVRAHCMSAADFAAWQLSITFPII